MRFANPGFTPWLLLLAVPVIIHFFTRKAVRTRPLPTFRFLERSLAKQSRLFRLRDGLLLLLRFTLVLLLVLVFLKPVRMAPLGMIGTGRRVAVIVLDRSMSVGWRSAGVTSFQRLQAHADRVLRGLGSDDRANIIQLTATPAAILPTPSEDHETLRMAMRRAAPVPERGDVSAAIALAVEQLARTPAARRELYLLSDFQRTNWADARLDTLPGQTRVVIIGSGETSRMNTAITDLSLRPAAPRVGQAVTADVEVWNGSGLSRDLTVHFGVGTTPSRSQTIRVGPYSSGTISFPLSFSRPGRYICSASLAPDSLPDDNTRWMVASVQPAMTVVLLTDENADAPSSSAYYLARALAPAPDNPGSVRVLRRQATNLTDADLRTADAVILTHLGPLSREASLRLIGYVKDGGDLVIFLVGSNAPRLMRTLEQIAGRDAVLPFLPMDRMDLGRWGQGFVRLSDANFSSRLLRRFQDPMTIGLGRVRFYRVYSTTEPDPRAEVLLRFEDNTPAMTRCSLGSGNILICNYSPAPADSDLSRQEVFPPLLHEMLDGLADRAEERLDFVVGGMASTKIAGPGSDIHAIGPDGRPCSIIRNKPEEDPVIPRTMMPGIYTIVAGGKESGKVAVNTSPDESDLRELDIHEWQTNHQPPSSWVFSGSSSDPLWTDITQDRQLWPWFLLAAFAVLVMEYWLAGMGGDRRRAVKKPL